jgi:hypothetical protein
MASIQPLSPGSMSRPLQRFASDRRRKDFID